MNQLEYIWILAKFHSRNALFLVFYRSELESPNFFENLYEVLEKAWIKSNCIFLPGDLNCNLLDINETLP